MTQSVLFYAGTSVLDTLRIALSFKKKVGYHNEDYAVSLDGWWTRLVTVRLRCVLDRQSRGITTFKLSVNNSHVQLSLLSLGSLLNGYWNFDNSAES